MKKVAPKPKRSAYNFQISAERLEKMNGIREKWGTPIAEQIRRGVDMWLDLWIQQENDK